MKGGREVYHEEVVEVSIADPLTRLLRIQKAKELHADDCEPNEEDQCHYYDDQQTCAIPEDFEEKFLHIDIETQETGKTESLQGSRHSINIINIHTHYRVWYKATRSPVSAHFAAYKLVAGSLLAYSLSLTVHPSGKRWGVKAWE